MRSRLCKLRLTAGLALAVGLLVPQAALGAGAGSFGPTGSMGTARYAAAGAPLPDGRVLVAGGYYDDSGGDHYLASAEVFNPATGAFSSAGIGSMGTARRAPAAAPLPDGRVLVAGGSNDDGGGEHYLASAEVFNPATNTFSSAGIDPMGRARTGAVAVPLSDGRVLVAGSYDGSTRFSSAEIFAATNAFSFAVKGRKLLVSVHATGRVSVSDAAAGLSASAGKRKKRRLLLRSSESSGDRPTLTVPLHLSKLARQRLRRTGRVAVRARITFVPQGGPPACRPPSSRSGSRRSSNRRSVAALDTSRNLGPQFGRYPVREERAAGRKPLLSMQSSTPGVRASYHRAH